MSDESIVVHNGSRRSFKTSKGILPVGGSLELDSIEARALMGYQGVQDTSAMVPQTASTIDGLKKRIAELEETIKNLEAQLAGSAPSDSTAAPTPEPELEEAGHAKGKKARR